jgi:hypothetical protein
MCNDNQVLSSPSIKEFEINKDFIEQLKALGTEHGTFAANAYWLAYNEAYSSTSTSIRNEKTKLEKQVNLNIQLEVNHILEKIQNDAKVSQANMEKQKEETAKMKQEHDDWLSSLNNIGKIDL